MGQGAGTKLCWATCISSATSYKNKPYKSPAQVAASIGKGSYDGATLYDVRFALSTAYGMGSTINNSNLYINTIVNNIDRDNPIITHVGVANGQGGFVYPHCVLISGYVDSGTAADDYVTFMDPDINGGSFMTTVYGNFQYNTHNPNNPSGTSVYEAVGYVTL